MGLENSGMETVFQCEWDKHCRTILDRHWPTVPKWDDVSTLTGEHILAHAPIIDVVAWGSPCQDLSVAGKRAGLEGGRSGLFYEGIRIINELRKASNGKYPRISIWENVYGALNSNKGEDFEAILKEMVEAGSLLCEWRVLDAQYFGVPQRRRRVFVVAVFDPATANRCPDPLLPISEGLRWNLTTRTETREESADTLTGSLGSGGAVANTISASLYHHQNVVNQDANNGHVVIEDLPKRLLGSNIVGSLNATDYKWPQNQQRDENKFIVQPSESAWPTLRKEGNEHAVAIPIQEPLVFQPGTMIRLNGGVWDGVVPTLRAESKRGDNEPHIAIQYDGYNQKINDTDIAQTLRLGRDSSDFVAQPVEPVMLNMQGSKGNSATTEDGISYSLNAMHGHDVHAITVPTMAVRRLTPLECERLMGWPDDHTRYKADNTEQTDGHRYKQCGNGVASPVAEWIGEQLRNL